MSVTDKVMSVREQGRGWMEWIVWAVAEPLHLGLCRKLQNPAFDTRLIVNHMKYDPYKPQKMRPWGEMLQYGVVAPFS
jgi:hypothetical protein